jgi:ribosomal protein L11 methyltransferase
MTVEVAESWVEIVLDRVPRDVVELLCAALWAAGVGGIEERDPPDLAVPPLQPWDAPNERAELPFAELRASVPEAAADAALAAIRTVWPEASPAVRPIPVVDWEAATHDAFPRVVVSERLAVAAPWNAEPGDVVIDPGLGFGTGHHPTTAAILRVIDRRLPPGASPGSVLDVGTGSGILALAAARLGARAHGLDVDAEAVAQAGRNAALSGLDVRFDTTPLTEVRTPADLVLANLHAEVLVLLADELVRLTRATLAVAGVLDDREAPVRAALEPRLRLVERHVEPPWICLVYEAVG